MPETSPANHNTGDIHDVIRQRYGSIAVSGSQSCCGPANGAACDCGTPLYDTALLETLPADLVNLSLGCGDPVTIAGIRPGETVLDLGSGAGMDCFLAARQAGETGHIIGLDMTPEMIERARSNAARLALPQVEFRLGQIEAIPLEDNSVDVIISNCVINLVPDKKAAFRQMFRVLKPGGRISISDIVADGDFSPALLAQTDLWAECVTGAIPAADYLEVIAQAGFVDALVLDKASAEGIVPQRDGMPRVFSARLTARKPA